jgi:hypothetical protein
VSLEKDKEASRQMLRQLEKEAANERRGLANPRAEAHARKSLVEHLADFRTAGSRVPLNS